MGNLTPGAKYIYENDGYKIYSRKEGSNERTIVGETKLYKQLKKQQLWHDILEAAETNSALHLILEQAKMLYYLSKENGT